MTDLNFGRGRRKAPWNGRLNGGPGKTRLLEESGNVVIHALHDAAARWRLAFSPR